MAKIRYMKEQIKKIESNKYVKDCTEKYITFTDEFKLKCIELDKEGIFGRDIFEKYGFPKYIINSKIPGESIRRWRFKYKKGELIGNTKGRKKKEIYDISKMTEDEELEYLRTENAVLKELKKMLDGDYP